MSAPQVTNDPDIVIPAAAKAAAHLDEYRTAGRQLNDLLTSQQAIKGSVQTALANKGNEMYDAVNRAVTRSEPRVEAVNRSASATANVSEEGSGIVSNIDTTA